MSVWMIDWTQELMYRRHLHTFTDTAQETLWRRRRDRKDVDIQYVLWGDA